MDNYEERQIVCAYRDAMRRFNGDAKAAAEAYGEDVKCMLAHNPTYWDGLGLIRLYTRIAVRLACDFASC